MKSQSPSHDTEKTSFTCKVHPPERSKKKGVVAACACSCCCCCLHSLGSFSGAIYGSRAQKGEDPAKDFLPLIMLYWFLVLGSLSLIVLYSTSSGMVSAIDLNSAGFMALLGLPAFQLVASAFTALCILFLPFKDKPSSFRLIGRITGYTILGTVLGILGMIILVMFL